MQFSPGRASHDKQLSCRVSNAAARVITGMQKFDRGVLSRLLQTDLHWFDVHERVECEIISCDGTPLSQRSCSQYLSTYSVVAPFMTSRQHLRSAQLAISWEYRLTTSVRMVVHGRR